MRQHSPDNFAKWAEQAGVDKAKFQQALKGIRRHSKKFRSRIGEFRLRMAAERIASINGKSQPAFYSGSSDVAWSDTYTGFHKEAKSSASTA